MSKESESNLNEMMAGDGSGLQLPPAFVMVNPRQHRRYKKGNQDKVDGRSKGARSLFDRIQKRKMKEQVETQIDEAIVSDTEGTKVYRSRQKTQSPERSSEEEKGSERENDA